MTAENATRSGRLAGVLVLAQLVFALMLPFILLDRVRAGAGMLVNAAPHAAMLRTAVFLLIAGSAIAIAISVVVLPVLQDRGASLGYWLLALATAGFVLQCVDCAALLSLLSLSQEYTAAGTAQAGGFEGLALVVSTARRWSHYSYLLVAVSWIVLLNAAMFRFRLVPRWLAGLALFCALLQIGGVSVRAILGYAPAMWLAVPLAPAYLTVASWLMVRGFGQPQGSPATAD